MESSIQLSAIVYVERTELNHTLAVHQPLRTLSVKCIVEIRSYRYGCGSKKRYPKWNPGKWKYGPKPAKPLLFNFEPRPYHSPRRRSLPQLPRTNNRGHHKPWDSLGQNNQLQHFVEPPHTLRVRNLKLPTGSRLPL